MCVLQILSFILFISFANCNVLSTNIRRVNSDQKLGLFGGRSVWADGIFPMEAGFNGADQMQGFPFEREVEAVRANIYPDSQDVGVNNFGSNINNFDAGAGAGFNQFGAGFNNFDSGMSSTGGFGEESIFGNAGGVNSFAPLETSAGFIYSNPFESIKASGLLTKIKRA